MVNSSSRDAAREWLKRLGAGESIEAVCESLGLTRAEFERLWRETAAARVPKMEGRCLAAVGSPVEIERDRWGIPHIYAETDADLFFGLGYTMAQDRLFQLDYLRRKGLGRLAEILGPDGLQSDLVARTVGLHRIAAAEWERLSSEVRGVLEAFSAGVNAFLNTTDVWPIEFDLLDYRPERWSPIDSLAIENEFRWYLTGRFPVIVIPELAKRSLGEGPLYEGFLRGEADEEAIVHPAEFVPRLHDPAGLPREPVGHVMNDPDAAVGSNNWVLAGNRTTTGLPLLASDPHIALEAVSCWYEAHLCGGSYNVAGMAYAGMPAIMFGRNEHVAWGITNNICSLRDLYQEQISPAHPGCFLYDGCWEPARELVEVIHVRGAAPVSKTIRLSRNGPVVNEILPAPARDTGPVTLKWLGMYQGGWLTSLLGMGRAANIREFREALRPWHVPTFSLVFADVEGQIGFHTAGRIPVRNTLCRSYRPGWDPEHQWQGLIPFEQMPQLENPDRGWIATANNRLAPDDYPHLLFGCWSSGWRAVRIRQMIEGQERHSAADMGRMQQDDRSLRAEDLVPPLVAALADCDDARLREAVGILSAWYYCVELDSLAATIFNVFFSLWCRAVANERFDKSTAELIAGGMPGLAGRLLHADPCGWFAPHHREMRIRATFLSTLDLLTERFGPEVRQWSWGKLHQMPLPHVLSSRGDLGRLLNQGHGGVRGDMATVCNSGLGSDNTANSGAGYRLIADLSSSPPSLLAIDGQSQSGHVGSSHYRDQYEDWAAGRYHEICLCREEANKRTLKSLRLEPRT
jgi:penicillin amidase